MNGQLAQMVALAAGARVALSTGDERHLPGPANTTFRYVHSLRFERARPRRFRGAAIETVGSSVAEWFRSLRAEGVTSIRLTTWSGGDQEVPDHVAIAFAGSGTWGMRTDAEQGACLWTVRWDVESGEDPESRIWGVVYRRLALEGLDAPERALGVAAADLDQALSAAETFARDADEAFWADWLRDARGKLSATTSPFEYHPDMLPEVGYSTDARSLLAACERAWVFGGMGSWNDMGWSDDADLDRRYREVTPALYAAILEGVAAAVNSPLD